MRVKPAGKIEFCRIGQSIVLFGQLLLASTLSAQSFEFEAFSSAKAEPAEAQQEAYYQAITKASSFFGIKAGFWQQVEQRSEIVNGGESARKEQFQSVASLATAPHWLFGEEIVSSVKRTKRGFVARSRFRLDTAKTMSHLRSTRHRLLHQVEEFRKDASPPTQLSKLLRLHMLETDLDRLEGLLGTTQNRKRVGESDLLAIPGWRHFYRRLHLGWNPDSSLTLSVEVQWPFQDGGMESFLWPVEVGGNEVCSKRFRLHAGMHRLKGKYSPDEKVCLEGLVQGSIPPVCGVPIQRK